MKIVWPVILKRVADDELTYLDNLSHFKEYIVHEMLPPSTNDLLVDIHGQCFQLTRCDISIDGVFIWQNETKFELDDINTLLKRHYSLNGECCVAKLAFRTIEEGIRSLVQSQTTIRY